MVILVNGSPRGKMCTYRALEEVASALNANEIETEIIQATENEDEVRKIAERIVEAEGLVVGSPVYYASPSALVKGFMDTLFNVAGGKMRLKPAAAVVSCRRGGASATYDVLNKYFGISEMLIVSSDYWNQVHGNTPEEVEKDEEGMHTMRELGNNMAHVIKAFRAAALPVPPQDKKVKTNFIR